MLLCALAVLLVPGPARAVAHPPVAAKGPCATRQCHAALLPPAAVAPGGSRHQPAVDGDCGSCHDLTLAAGARFVRGAPVAAEDGGAMRAWDLALCTGCHGGALLAPAAPAGATGFAAGRRNLHALHAQAGRGRRCLTCHDPHGARQPKLLRERIPSQRGAQVNQEFRGGPRGGWCRTGCHAPKSYQR